MTDKNLRKMNKRGYFIVVEGLEGAGKSTAIKAIKQYLDRLRLHVLTTREPGGTKIGEDIRQLLKYSAMHDTMDPVTELLLLYAARVQLLKEVILPALDAGTWIIADRFELSTFAYQGGGRQLDKQIISTLSVFCVQDFTPDLTIFLDVKPELGLQRIQYRGKMVDRFEQEPLNFFTNVANSYYEMIKNVKNLIIIDANQALATVHQAIIVQLEHFLIHNDII